MRASLIVVRGALSLALGFCAGAARASLDEVEQCQAIPDEIVFFGPSAEARPPRRVERYGAETRTLAANPEGYAGHGMGHFRNCSARPAGRRMQVLRFSLRSEGYFFPGVVNHIAIGLRSRLTGFAPGVHSGNERFQGRGIVIGSIAGGWPVEDLCPGPFPLVQPETWGRQLGVTRLWGQATAGENHCGPGLKDGQWYRFIVKADDASLRYTVYDDKGQMLRDHRFVDVLTRAPDRDEIRGNSGYFVAVMCADADASCRSVPTWRLQLKDFKVSWQ